MTALSSLPDVIECLANLSSDEVFTPPAVANAMLDLLPQDIFADPNTTILDPAVKNGIFLREAAKRFIQGEEAVIPDLKERVEHIMRHQLFGIALTELTALTGRRTLYCSAHAAGKYSVCKFDTDDGNIRYAPTEHTFKNGKCIYCGAAETAWGKAARGGKESHAYGFIHVRGYAAVTASGCAAVTVDSDGDGEEEEMHFDVVVGNPPYQMSTGDFQARPIYQHFVETAKALNPRYISMIMPARWYAGGMGLDEFRARMLHDRHIKELHDYPIAEDCFPGIRVAGGLCYFLWDKEYDGDCTVYSHHKSGKMQDSVMTRPLLEAGADTFIRMNEGISILHKVQAKGEKSFATVMSAIQPFGLPSDFFKDPSKYGLPPIYENKQHDDDITIVGVSNYKAVKRYVPHNYPFPRGKEYIGKYKVFVSQVLDNGFDWTRERLQPFMGEPYDVCTMTFLCAGCYDDKKTAENVLSYMNTKFLNLLMQLRKVSHHVTAKVYQFVPLQDFSPASPIDWTQSTAGVDKALYDKYGLTEEEREFIEGMVREM